jgi:hypothetical protein
MRLRVLHVEGMVRPLLVIDEVGALSPEGADIMSKRVADGVRSCDVLVVAGAVELPQAKGRGEQ